MNSPRLLMDFTAARINVPTIDGKLALGITDPDDLGRIVEAPAVVAHGEFRLPSDNIAAIGAVMLAKPGRRSNGTKLPKSQRGLTVDVSPNEKTTREMLELNLDEPPRPNIFPITQGVLMRPGINRLQMPVRLPFEPRTAAELYMKAVPRLAAQMNALRTPNPG